MREWVKRMFKIPLWRHYKLQYLPSSKLAIFVLLISYYSQTAKIIQGNKTSYTLFIISYPYYKH